MTLAKKRSLRPPPKPKPLTFRRRFWTLGIGLCLFVIIIISSYFVISKNSDSKLASKQLPSVAKPSSASRSTQKVLTKSVDLTGLRTLVASTKFKIVAATTALLLIALVSVLIWYFVASPFSDDLNDPVMPADVIDKEITETNGHSQLTKDGQNASGVDDEKEEEDQTTTIVIGACVSFVVFCLLLVGGRYAFSKYRSSKHIKSTHPKAPSPVFHQKTPTPNLDAGKNKNVTGKPLPIIALPSDPTPDNTIDNVINNSPPVRHESFKADNEDEKVDGFVRVTQRPVANNSNDSSNSALSPSKHDEKSDMEQFKPDPYAQKPLNGNDGAGQPSSSPPKPGDSGVVKITKPITDPDVFELPDDPPFTGKLKDHHRRPLQFKKEDTSMGDWIGAISILYPLTLEGLPDRNSKFIMKSFNLKNEEQKDDFIQESEVFQKIPPHNNIVQVYWIGEYKKNYGAIIMEYLEQGNLEEYKFSLPGDKHFLASIAKSVLLALKHLHEHNIVHNDVKPKNIAVSLNGTFKLLDFGCAGEAEGGGDCEFTAPESHQPAFWKITNKVDVYSLGLSLISLSTYPYPGGYVPVSMTHHSLDPGNRHDMKAFYSDLHKKKETHFPFPQMIEDLGTKDDYYVFLKRCLTLRPEDRASVDDLLADPFIKRARVRQNSVAV